MNGICDHDADQRNYATAASSLEPREGRRILDRGVEAWTEYIDRDLIYQWLAKHAQRSNKRNSDFYSIINCKGQRRIAKGTR